ncbi:GNAT family N-acetyltransferase [Algimonas ampicilliniresistens]|jgi:GNAT superfamily N-acetyltransferase|nr:GNAT family N-acetyltransferase [Algimonas ampicilliniresistens]
MNEILRNEEMGLSDGLMLRVAGSGDIPAIRTLQALSIAILQRGYLDDAQIEASRVSMGLDTQLIDDGTYFCVFDDETLVGCGGWSNRATLYGGDHSAGRSARKLDPATDRARIRAMYTHPDHARRGIGRSILMASEFAARNHGFKALEMASTEAGRPFYERCGYAVENSFFDHNGGVAVPLYTMVKALTPVD